MWLYYIKYLLNDHILTKLVFINGLTRSDHIQVSFTLAYSRISHEYSSLFIRVINLVFVFSL